MNVETLKDLAAFGGFGLGLINLYLLVYDKYLRKGGVEIDVHRADVKLESWGAYIAEIDFELRAKRRKIWIKSIYVRNDQETLEKPASNAKNSQYIKTDRALVSPVFSIVPRSSLDDSGSDIEKSLKEANERGFTEDAVALEENELRGMRAILKLRTTHEMDGPEYLPLSKWHLVVELGHTSTEVPFTFNIHHTSPTQNMAPRVEQTGFKQ